MFTPLDFVSLVRNQVVAIQGLATNAVDFAIGSILRAVVQSNASVALFLQSLILQVLVSIRASTCSGDDLDTWMADYGMTRTAAVAATGMVTFSRFTSTQKSVVPLGATIETLDGSQQYVVIADTTNPKFDNAQGGYVLDIGVSSVDVMVQASIAGTAGNAHIEGINTITSTIVGVDSVVNNAAFVNGQDAESDDELRARFVLFIASLSKGTKGAIEYAITSLQVGVSCTLVENYDYNGVFTPGYFYVIADDGTGAPALSFLDRVYAAVDLVRAFTVRFNVFAPTLVNIDVSLTLTIDSNYDDVTIKAAVSNAITEYINCNRLGGDVLYHKIPSLAFFASPGVLNVQNVLLNGVATDVAINDKQRSIANNITVN